MRIQKDSYDPDVALFVQLYARLLLLNPATANEVLLLLGQYLAGQYTYRGSGRLFSPECTE